MHPDRSQAFSDDRLTAASSVLAPQAIGPELGHGSAGTRQALSFGASRYAMRWLIPGSGLPGKAHPLSGHRGYDTKDIGGKAEPDGLT